MRITKQLPRLTETPKIKINKDIYERFTLSQAYFDFFDFENAVSFPCHYIDWVILYSWR